MKKLLLVIDYQVDFVAEEGKLTAGEPAVAIETNLVQRIQSYREQGNDVICTMDTHSEQQWHNHPEESSFPIHCKDQSSGWKLFGQLEKMDLETISKASYMLDFSDIDWMVKDYDLVELAGVTTDICVLQNAVGLYNHAANIGKKLTLTCRPDCVASFDQQGHEYALKYMHDKLGMIIDTED